MNNQESHEHAFHDILDLIQSWEEKDIVVYEGIYAGLSLFLQMAIDMAPNKSAAFGMLSASIQDALDRSNKE